MTEEHLKKIINDYAGLNTTDWKNLKQFIDKRIESMEKTSEIEIMGSYESSKEQQKKFLTIKEASDLMGIGQNTLRELTFKHKDFPFFKSGTKRLIIIDEVTKWFSNHRGETI